MNRKRMERSWLINSRGIANKVKNATFPSDHPIKDCGATRECPNCRHRIDNSDVFPDWPGLPIGVKFEPSDEELIEHLAAKCGVGNTKPHMFIDEFIPTLDGQGIYREHPENLPGAKKDGSNIHFFHKTVNAYATGQRKRRKVQSHQGSEDEHVRWHKTGKTKPVVNNGSQKGWKKIMVLYKSGKNGSKPDKANWVMHQYHLGSTEDEKEGEFVVSKISHQKPKNVELINDEDKDLRSGQTSPMTPNSYPPVPPRHAKPLLCAPENKLNLFSPTEGGLLDETDYPSWFAAESQAVDDADLNLVNDSLLCKETFDFGYDYTNSIFDHEETKFPGQGIEPSSVADLRNIEVDSPPYFDPTNLQFCSQDSLTAWLDRI